MLRINASPRTFLMPLLLLALASCSLFEGQETTGQYIDDATITTKIKEAYIGDPVVKVMQVNVETMQGVVQLSGFVDSADAESRAVHLAEAVRGVKQVKDSIVVRKRNNGT